MYCEWPDPGSWNVLELSAASGDGGGDVVCWFSIGSMSGRLSSVLLAAMVVVEGVIENQATECTQDLGATAPNQVLIRQFRHYTFAENQFFDSVYLVSWLVVCKSYRK